MARELARLDALVAHRRARARVRRSLRGIGGGAVTLAILLKVKVAGSLALKLGLAALVGLILAWPILALAALALLGLVLWIVSLFEGGGSSPHVDLNGPFDCARGERRAAHLARMRERRRTWLADPVGPAPHPRDDAPGNRAARP